MIDTNTNKEKQLGMKLGTATNRLRRIIMWNLIIKAGESKCFRCQLEMAVDNYSIDHKIPWLYSNTTLFWDIDNITFSHLYCNTGSRREKIIPHGWTKYKKGCRCPICKRGAADKVAKYRAKYNRR